MMPEKMPIRTAHHPPTYALRVRLSIAECGNEKVRSIALEHNDFQVSLCARPGAYVLFNAVTTYPPSPRVELTLLVYDDAGRVASTRGVTFNALFGWNGLTVAPHVRVFVTKQVLCDPARELDPRNTVDLCEQFCTSAMRTRIYTFDECPRKRYTVPPVKAVCSIPGLRCVPVTSLVDAPNKMVTWVIQPPEEGEDEVCVGNGVFVPKRKLNKAKPKPNEPAPCGHMSLLQASVVRPLNPIPPRVKELGRPAFLRSGAILDALDYLDSNVTYVDDSKLDRAEAEEALLKKIVSQDIGKTRKRDADASARDGSMYTLGKHSSRGSVDDTQEENLRENRRLAREKLWSSIEPLRLDSNTGNEDLAIHELEQFTEVLLRRIHTLEQMASRPTNARGIAGEGRNELTADAVVKLSSNVSEEEEGI